MIDAPSAIKSAQDAATLVLNGYTDMRLEEVELAEDEQLWKVTFSAFPPPSTILPSDPPAVQLSSMFKKDPRVYKSVGIDAQTGSMKYVRIRQL